MLRGRGGNLNCTNQWHKQFQSFQHGCPQAITEVSRPQFLSECMAQNVLGSMPQASLFSARKIMDKFKGW